MLIWKIPSQMFWLEYWAIMAIATIRCIFVMDYNMPWHCCDVCIQIKWVLFRMAIYRPPDYNPIFCPVVSVELRCFAIGIVNTAASLWFTENIDLLMWINRSEYRSKYLMGRMGIFFTSVVTSWWGEACSLSLCFPTGSCVLRCT